LFNLNTNGLYGEARLASATVDGSQLVSRAYINALSVDGQNTYANGSGEQLVVVVPGDELHLDFYNNSATQTWLVYSTFNIQIVS
jgi:hypothetical protein